MQFMTPELTQALMAVSGALITGLVGWVAQTTKQRTGYDINARAQATLHSALNTGALMAWSRLSDGVIGPSREDLIQIVLGHAFGEGASGAIAQLQVSQIAVRNLAEAKLMDVGLRMQGTPAAAGFTKSSQPE